MDRSSRSLGVPASAWWRLLPVAAAAGFVLTMAWSPGTVRQAAMATVGIAAREAFGAPSAAAQVSEAAAEGLTVVGDGEIMAAPDQALVTVGVQSTGATAAEVMEENSRAMQAVIEAIKRLGIADRDIQTTTIGLSPAFAPPRPPPPPVSVPGPPAPAPPPRPPAPPTTPPPTTAPPPAVPPGAPTAPPPSTTAPPPAPPTLQPPGPPEIVGYRAQNTVVVRTRDLALIGRVIDAAVEAGANQVGGVTFGLRDDLPLRREALAAATRHAREKAESIAAAAGVRITGIRAIVEDGAAIPVPRAVAFGGERIPAALAVPVQPGELTIRARLRVTYAYN